MIVKDRIKRSRFADIECGDVVRLGRIIYIKCIMEDGTIGVVSLKTGSFYTEIDDETIVECVDGEFIERGIKE